MKKTLALMVLLYSAAAFAQSSPPPAGGKMQPAKSRTSGKSVAEKLLACLELDDGTKDRLDCYDAVTPPKPKPRGAPVPNGVMDCRYTKEEDERLACFNKFAEKIPKFSR
jgi:hypothetical protein